MNPATATIMVGHVIDMLKQMPAGSVHCAITSPPYWGLRAYGTPPQVWGGDSSCEHEWRSELKPAANGMVYSEMVDRREGGSLNDMSATRKAHASESCPKCGAWRGEHGLEPTVDLYLRHVLLWTREVRRVLRPDGVFFLNMGDCYYSGDRGVYQNTRTRYDSLQQGNLGSDFGGAPNRMPQTGLKDKDLVQMPARVSLMLQSNGWWLRSKIIWAKGVSFLPGYSGSVMPESIGDRPTRAYEEVFLLTRSQQYFCDMDAIREESVSQDPRRPYGSEGMWAMDGRSEHQRHGGEVRKSLATMRRDICREELGLRTAERFGHAPGWRDKTALTPHLGGRRQAPEPGEPNAFHPLGRNVRDVWVINPEPFEYEACRACGKVYDGGEYALLADTPRDGDAPPKKVCRCGRPDAWVSHFATFPEKLVFPCIRAGSSEKGCCAECGAPWERIVEAEGGTIGQDWNVHDRGDAGTLIGHTVGNGAKGGHGYRRIEKGWQSTCDHSASTVPCTVLDPFAGSGTVLMVAAKNGRHSIGVELQEDYIPLIGRRLRPVEFDLVHPLEIRVERSHALS